MAKYTLQENIRMKAPTIAQINAMGFQNVKQLLCWFALQLEAGSKGYGAVQFTNPATPATPLKIAANKPANNLYNGAVSIAESPRQTDPENERGKDIDLFLKFPISRAALAVGAIGDFQQIDPLLIFPIGGDAVDLNTWIGIKPSPTPTTMSLANCFGVNLTGLTSTEQMFVKIAQTKGKIQYINDTIDGAKYARAAVSVDDIYLFFGAANLLECLDIGEGNNNGGGNA
jgi:hypothetical protein